MAFLIPIRHPADAAAAAPAPLHPRRIGIRGRTTQNKNQTIRVQHALQNRIRYRLPNFRHHRRLYEPLLRMLDTTAGVQRTRLNTKCASLIVRFDPGTITRPEPTRMLTFF